jgi:hypothetical protein
MTVIEPCEDVFAAPKGVEVGAAVGAEGAATLTYQCARSRGQDGMCAWPLLFFIGPCRTVT